MKTKSWDCKLYRAKVCTGVAAGALPAELCCNLGCTGVAVVANSPHSAIREREPKKKKLIFMTSSLM